MSKANRTCYCCGREYYYCPSCPGDKKNPRIYTMWDSELCRDIFNTLVSESTKKITTLECKNKLIELGVSKDTKLKDSIRKHADRVMSYKEEKVEEVKLEVLEEVSDNTDISVEEKEEVVEIKETAENVKKTSRTKARKSSYNKENSEVD